MAIKGIARFYKDKKRHVITTQTEHKCVLDSCRALEAEGFEVSRGPGLALGFEAHRSFSARHQVTYLPVQSSGLIDLDELQRAVRPGETSLVSIMGVNNEIGVIQPLKEIGQVSSSIFTNNMSLILNIDAADM